MWAKLHMFDHELGWRKCAACEVFQFYNRANKHIYVETGSLI